MAEEEQQENLDRGRWSCLAIVVGLASLLMVTYILYRVALKYRVRRKIETLRAKGLPVSPEQLEESYPEVPEDQDAAPIFRQAFDVMVQAPEGKWDVLLVVGLADWPPPGEPLSPEMAAERFRARRGSLPGKLSDLVPEYIAEIPADPFDGKPVRYRQLLEGYIVYSVGQDRVDSGGERSDDPDRGDVVFTVGQIPASREEHGEEAERSPAH